MVIHVAIAVSQRVECLNLFLDILKNNFNNSYVTHVFCNLSEVDMKTYGKYIDVSLIDHFYHFPDDCSMKQKTYDDKVKHKRIQPLRFIKKIFETMSRNTNFEKFIYTECDVYPLVEEDYVRYYEKIIDEKLFAYCVLKKGGKGPNGLIIPSPIYIHNIHAKKISDSIYENSADVQKCSFEGLLMTAIKNSGINLEAISYSTPDNCNFEKNLSRETMTTHQHNILNLHQSLRESKILSGNWVREVLENEKIYEIHSGEELLKNENFKLQYCCGCTNDSLCVYHKPSPTPTTKNLLDLIKKMEFEVMALNDSLQFVRNKRS